MREYLIKHEKPLFFGGGGYRIFDNGKFVLQKIITRFFVVYRKLRLQAVQEQQLNEKKIYQMLLEFDRIYDRLSLDEQRSVLQSLISEVQIYKKDEIKESKTYIKKIKFTFDIENIGEILDNKGNHVEVVCLLEKADAETQNLFATRGNIQ